MQKVLVTGANGFIGSNLCRYFAERGFEVHGLVRKTSDLHFLEGLPVRLVYGDLAVPDAFELPQGMDYVVHSASLTSDLASEEECERGIHGLTVNIFEALKRLSPRPRRIVFLSTTLVLGFDGENLSDKNPGRSTDFLPYSRAKKKAEACVRRAAELDGLPAVILRPGDVYGPNDRTTSAHLLAGVERGTPLTVARGKWRLPYCYIDNLCQAAHLACLAPGIEGRAYAVTNSELPTWKMVFSRLQAGLGRKQWLYVPIWAAWLIAASQELRRKLNPRFTPVVSFYRIKRITTETTYDISDTIADLGYHPDNDLDAQIRSVVSWYIEEKKRGRIK